MQRPSELAREAAKLTAEEPGKLQLRMPKSVIRSIKMSAVALGLSPAAYVQRLHESAVGKVKDTVGA